MGVCKGLKETGVPGVTGLMIVMGVPGATGETGEEAMFECVDFNINYYYSCYLYFLF
jgi:hypothetical protein